MFSTKQTASEPQAKRPKLATDDDSKPPPTTATSSSSNDEGSSTNAATSMPSSEPVPKNPSIKYPKVDYSQLINVDEILQQSGEDPAVAVGRLLELVFNTEVEQVTSLLKGTRYAHLPENMREYADVVLGRVTKHLTETQAQDQEGHDALIILEEVERQQKEQIERLQEKIAQRTQEAEDFNRLEIEAEEIAAKQRAMDEEEEEAKSQKGGGGGAEPMPELLQQALLMLDTSVIDMSQARRNIMLGLSELHEDLVKPTRIDGREAAGILKSLYQSFHSVAFQGPNQDTVADIQGLATAAATTSTAAGSSDE